MRMMMKVKMDVEAANAAIKSGKIAQVMERVLGMAKPEAVYFTTEGGQRTGFIFFDLKATSDMPVLAEPFFMELKAGVEWAPVMNAQELQEGLKKLG